VHAEPGSEATGAGRRAGGGALWALAVANARFWPTVAPQMRRELARWEAPATAIADPALRALALEKLREERFNAEVAATLATLAPRSRRPEAVRAIVALELLFDYLDERTEQPGCDPLAEGALLFAPFVDSVTPAGARAVGVDGLGGEAASPAGRNEPEPEPDDGYRRALAGVTREALSAMPATAAVAASAHEAASRCALAQTRLHATHVLGDGQLREWAELDGAGSGLAWREYTAGCASSVLAVHALIAAAAEPVTSETDAARIDAAYLAIGALITILDSVVDHGEDTARRRPGFIRLYEPGELPEVCRALVREALRRSALAPHAEHHTMTLAGVAAYYTSHPGAGDPDARDVVRIVRAELAPTIWPALGVMHAWRAAKRAHSAAGGRRGGAPSDASASRDA
jgi:tetraprenyl-beta-curcumene synthase